MISCMALMHVMHTYLTLEPIRDKGIGTRLGAARLLNCLIRLHPASAASSFFFCPREDPICDSKYGIQ